MKSSKYSLIESLADHLKGAGSPLFLKAVGRDTKPVWGNRMVNDFYDLDYDIPSNISTRVDSLTKRSAKKIKRVVSSTNKGLSAGKTVNIDNHSEVISSRKKSQEKAAFMEMYRHNP
jgi:hypothetical protein